MKVLNHHLQGSCSLEQLHTDGGVGFIVRSIAGCLLLECISAHRLDPCGRYSKYQNDILSRDFRLWGKDKCHWDWDTANKGAGEPQECFLLKKKTHWWRFPYDMGRYRGAASKYVHTSSHTCHPPHQSHNYLWAIPCLWKNHLCIGLILGLLTLAFLGRGDLAVCHSKLWHFVSGSYSKIHNSSRVTTRLKNSGSLYRCFRWSKHIFNRYVFCTVISFLFFFAFFAILTYTFLIMLN